MRGWGVAAVAVVTACVVGGGVLGWLALRQPSLNTLDGRDEIEVWTDDQAVGFAVWWELNTDGSVILRVLSSGDDEVPVSLEPAEVYVVLACGAQLDNVTETTVYGQNPETPWELEAGLGDPDGCDVAGAIVPVPERNYQILRTALMPGEAKAFTGLPREPWQDGTLGMRIASSPYMSALAVTYENVGGRMGYDAYPRLEELAATKPNSTRFYSILRAPPSEVRDTVSTPAGTPTDEVEERLSNVVLGAGAVVDSVTWSDEERLEPGFVRWTDPGGQSQAQWFLLLSGLLLGVAVSTGAEIVVDRARQEPRERNAAASAPRPRGR